MHIYIKITNFTIDLIFERKRYLPRVAFLLEESSSNSLRQAILIQYTLDFSRKKLQ